MRWNDLEDWLRDAITLAFDRACPGAGAAGGLAATTARAAGPVFAVACALALLPAAQGATPGAAGTAALQVALAHAGAYAGPIDGIDDATTRSALREYQSSHGLVADGIAGAQTSRALGLLPLGARPLGTGDRGWDVAELQFRLAWHGFPSGTFDGQYGAHLEAAVRRFQRFARLPADGVAGAATIAALGLPPPAVPIRLAEPVDAAIGDRFGPRGSRFHAGVDYPIAAGAEVRAAAAGRVVWVGSRPGWGLLVTVAHVARVRTLYAHLSRASVRLGQRVAAGAPIGLVGSSGDATGPHLHFEVRVGGAAVDPLSCLE